MKRTLFSILALSFLASSLPEVHSQPPIKPIHKPVVKHHWVLNHEDTQPTIRSNSEILLFVHGMDSRAEEADDMTKALFMLLINPSAPPAAVLPNPSIAVMNQLIQKYQSCIMEKYETQQDMLNRGLPANDSALTSTNGLVPRDVVTCAAGNQCSLASRAAGLVGLVAQANSGNSANFNTNLESIIPQDCFQCAKHVEEHTKHVHCTEEVGGNSGLIKGPEFEACKAGVDLTALAKQVDIDISNAISGLGNTPADVTGGSTIATNHVTLQFLSCSDPSKGCPDACDNPDQIVNGQRTAIIPAAYFEPVGPSSLFDPQNEGRLIQELRNAAQSLDPHNSLTQAAKSFASNDPVKGNAFADLSVTGHQSFAAFKINPPQEAFCQGLPASSPGQNAQNLIIGCRKALDRAYRVANFLRAGQRGDSPTLKASKTATRSALGWIAVSGEDDSPHRPVNVPSSDFPQYDLNVTVEAPLASGAKPVTVHTRYTVAQSNPSGTGKNLVVISVDLPTSGYADNLNYTVVSDLSVIGTLKNTQIPFPIVVPPGIEFNLPGSAPLAPGTTLAVNTPFPDFQATGKTPLLDFIETFIVNFAGTLDQQPQIQHQITTNLKAVMGGSLGGNMTFRLGRRPAVPWMPKFVVWSPASIWSSLGGGSDLFKHYGVRTAWSDASDANASTKDGDRASFFGSWDQATVPVIIPMAQSDTWTSDYYLCKKSDVAAARLDRHETYDHNFLAWHWRLAAEQLLFSQSNTNPSSGQPLYLTNQKPILLACGLEDHILYNDICPATQSTAALMTMTPGKALFLAKTGHSLDNERRIFWAQQVIQFLGL